MSISQEFYQRRSVSAIISGSKLTFTFLLAILIGGCAANSKQPVKEGGFYKVGQPYQINGVWYHPEEDLNYKVEGIASWYGPTFHGKKTANGEKFNQNDLTAAHPTLPIPCVVLVTNLENKKSVKLRVNDRGPFKSKRVIDVSRQAAEVLGFRNQGTAKVRVEVVKDESMQLKKLALQGVPSDKAAVKLTQNNKTEKPGRKKN